MSSLKCWLKKIEKQDRITPEELAEIMGMLDGHDEAIRREVRKQTLDELEDRMYHECFEASHEEDGLQKWDSGNWLRYKLFENVMWSMREQE